jgi:hypothetical protein
VFLDEPNAVAQPTRRERRRPSDAAQQPRRATRARSPNDLQPALSALRHAPGPSATAHRRPPGRDRRQRAPHHLRRLHRGSRTDRRDPASPLPARPHSRVESRREARSDHLH